MFVKALLLHIYFYNIAITYLKYLMAGNWFNFEYFLSKSKNQHICFHGNHGSNSGVRVVSVADSSSILISCIVYVKCIPVEVEI